MNMIGSKHSAIESAVDFISILCAFFQLFILTSPKCDVKDRTPETLSFVYMSRKKCMLTAIIFVKDCFYLCGVNI